MDRFDKVVSRSRIVGIALVLVFLPAVCLASYYAMLEPVGTFYLFLSVFVFGLPWLFYRYPMYVIGYYVFVASFVAWLISIQERSRE